MEGSVTELAVSTGEAILAWVGLGLGLVVAVLVVGLFNRVIGPALEIDRYAERILEGGVGIAKNLDDADEIERTRQLATAVPDLAGAYLRKIQGS
jgi:hypothetical protein